MRRKPKVSADIKIVAVKDYLKGEKSVLEICNELSVTKKAAIRSFFIEKNRCNL